MKTKPFFLCAAVVCLFPILTINTQSEVLIQYFETEWDEIYERTPELAEIGFQGIWHPSPTKAPVAGVFPNGFGGNVGYNIFDRFDIGDMPQRGTLRTRYGTRGSIRRMVVNAHQTGIKIYPDIVFNHAGNGPNIATYPGMRIEPDLGWADFHGRYDAGQPLNFKRADRMFEWTPDNGFGGTLWQELVSLIDIQLEPDNRFSPGGFADINLLPPGNYVRQPGQYERYPFHNPGDALPAETPIQFVERWINWLGYAIDFDGTRLDAPKHVVREFFGEPGSGFNHQIQWNFDDRRGHSDGNQYDEMYQNDLDRDDALIFGEMFIFDKSEVDYWRNWNGGQGPDNGSGVKMRYLDFPLVKQMMASAFNGGNMAALSGFSAFGDKEGISFVHSHDEDSIGKKELAYAYALTHVGLPVVFFTGNNFEDNFTGWKSWMLQGYENALDDWGGSPIPNLVYIHNNFARGNEFKRWDDQDVYVFERYEDLNFNSTPQSPEGLLLVGLNDSGSDQTRDVFVSFPDGTVLKDYTGNNGTDLTVSGGKVNLTIPGMGGQGFVCYAPYNASEDGDPIRLSQGSGAPNEMNWDVPGGRLSPGPKAETYTRLTDTNVTIDIHFNDPINMSAVDSVIVKWGQGEQINSGATYFGNKGIINGGFQQATEIGTGHWRLTADLSGLPEGFHLIQARAFNGRTDGGPALFQTFREVVYVDNAGPEVVFDNLDDSETIYGDRVIEISNPDKTAGSIEININNTGWETTHEIMRGFWRFAIQGLSNGNHNIEIRATEYDNDTPEVAINTTLVSRAFTVTTNGWNLSMNHVEGTEINLPFFTTSGTKDSDKSIKLLWDGYEMANVVDGTNAWDHVFTGAYISGGSNEHLWGAFTPGPHFFEAVMSDGGTNYQVVARTVQFDLYNKSDDFFNDFFTNGFGNVWNTTGSYGYDSDGDGLPDDIEIYGFSDGSNPGPNVPLPGDSNNDNIPNNGEFWTRLNPMNHDTLYNGVWDGDEDWDNDGFSNLCEVRQGFLEFGDPAHYSIYDGNVFPASCEGSSTDPFVTWTPENPQRCEDSTLTIEYSPNDGPLSNSTPVWVSIGYNGWTETNDVEMSAIGGAWQYVYDVPTNATDIEFYFRNAAGSILDTNGGNNWTSLVSDCVILTNYFVMNGEFDSDGYEVANSGMKILTARKDANLYVATWSANGDEFGSDHFIFITDEFQDPTTAPWSKDGQIYMDPNSKPYLASESAGSGGFHVLNNGGQNGRVAMGPGGSALEAEINLIEVFGEIPDIVYIAAVAYGDGDFGIVNSQCPPSWGGGNTIQIMEMLPVPMVSIVDDNLDGFFDSGVPLFETIVANSTNDANYNVRRFYIDETIQETEQISFRFQVETAPGDTVTDIELITNLNRRDFAALDYDLDDVTATNPTNYFRAYPMPDTGGGVHELTLPVHKTGAYRATVRYKVNGQTYYYTDFGLRRDLAIVVTPTTAKKVTMYELNPLMAEATDTSFFGRSTFRDMYLANTNRPDYINTGHFTGLGVNMIWLQPIHPIGFVNRQTDPLTGSDYDPGSPYAIRDYWEINPVLGDPWEPTGTQALTEFQNFITEMDNAGISVMLDSPFNHSAWDCEIGTMGVEMFDWATNATDYIRDIRPQWYSRKGDYGKRATYYQTPNNNDIAAAPDRNDFGKWSDAADFNFGITDTLVQGQTEAWKDRYLLERDWWAGHDQYSKEIWEYFSNYSVFWLEQTGHPVGTPKDQAYKGIDGLRCDFAQGMPSVFWEYVINKTRSVKWNFLFMAESLDGFREINGNFRHGLSYRSGRHFDILNENIVFYWRDTFFSYPANGLGSSGPAVASTAGTIEQYENRVLAYDNVMLLNNMTSHDEVFPSDNPYRMLYAYAQLAALDGLPLIMYGQEAGALNDFNNYAFNGGIFNADNNWEIYENNFGKWIPNFKRFNSMKKVWENRDGFLQEFYGRINEARLNSPALLSQNKWFLGQNDLIFGVAKYQKRNVSVAQQDVVFAFIINDHVTNPSASGTYGFDLTFPNGDKPFIINPAHSFELYDLVSTNPAVNIWGSPRSGNGIINDGVFVGLGDGFGEKVQYLRLVDISEAKQDFDMDGLSDATDDDDDNDGMKDQYEIDNGLDPLDATGDEGASGDKDGDGVSNIDEAQSGTDPDDASDYLRVMLGTAGLMMNVQWDAVEDINYQVQSTDDLLTGPWQNEGPLRTAFTNLESHLDMPASIDTNMNYRVIVKP